MVETIFRVIIIILIIVIILAVLSSFSMNFNITFGYQNLLLSFLSCVCYVLPFKKLMPIFVCVIAFSVFKVGISVLKTLWDIFPLQG